jgi:diacylglycerol kinase
MSLKMRLERFVAGNLSPLVPEHRAHSLRKSFYFAFSGLWYCFTTQRNMRIHGLVAVLALILSVYLKLPMVRLAVVILCSAMVICMEMLNTAIESAVDLAMPELHPIAKIAKDVAAAAVLVSACAAALSGVLLIGPDGT